ncbi:MAG: pitrilysin family protein, partial [Candidatus Falkowbacteria bacterium]|nr:pitrilysin family protein [Candidatus Falkowbacteria bacterium]
EFNAYTGQEFTGYWVKVEASKIEKAIEMLSEMLINSKFPTEEIERERGVILEEMNMIQDEPMRYIYSIFNQCLFGDTPLGQEIIGIKDNIKKFTRDNFVKYYNTHYTPDNLTIAVAGKLDNPEKLIEKYFSYDKKLEDYHKEAFVINQSSPKILIKQKKTDQAHLSIGFHAYPIGHQNEIGLKLIAKILGGCMSSRLFNELRGKNGLAYYVNSHVDSYTDAGYITSNAGVPVDKIEEAIQIIMTEYKKIKTTLISEEELARAKNIILGRLAIQLEASDEIAEWYAENFLMRNKIFRPEEFIAEVNKVTTADLQRIAKEILDESKLNLAVIGNYEDEAPFVKLLKI